MSVLSSASAHLATTINFSTSLIVYVVIAAVIGLLAEFLVGWRLPGGIIGAIIAALVGIWIVTNLIQLNIVGQPTVDGVPLVSALIGAIVLVAIWHILTIPLWRRRRRFYRRERRYRERY